MCVACRCKRPKKTASLVIVKETPCLVFLKQTAGFVLEVEPLSWQYQRLNLVKTADLCFTACPPNKGQRIMLDKCDKCAGSYQDTRMNVLLFNHLRTASRFAETPTRYKMCTVEYSLYLCFCSLVSKWKLDTYTYNIETCRKCNTSSKQIQNQHGPKLSTQL